MKTYNVREYGVVGDGIAIDSIAINALIASINNNDTGANIYFPIGEYLCYSIRLKDNINLVFDDGCKIIAAPFNNADNSYDLPDENPNIIYQDFGHSHWANSLIYGVNISNISIRGKCLIDGSNLHRESPGPLWNNNGEFPNSMRGIDDDKMAELVPQRDFMNGHGNKAIAFKNSENIDISDINIINGGHFAILMTGVKNLRIRNLLIDSNRDGIDIDCCQNVVIDNCIINTPNDDAIVLKSSLALGIITDTRDIHINNCTVSGYDCGSVYDQTFTTLQEFAPDMDRVTGRIKIGTETNGNFGNIKITNCNLRHCRGIAIETVDGGNIENLLIKNIDMAGITTAPIFIKIGARLRAPNGANVGYIKNISLKNINARNVLPDYCTMVLGHPESHIKNIIFENINIEHSDISISEHAKQFSGLIETIKDYPEPSMHGTTPASGLWVEYTDNFKMDGVNIITSSHDIRPQHLIIQNND